MPFFDPSLSNVILFSKFKKYFDLFSHNILKFMQFMPAEVSTCSKTLEIPNFVKDEDNKSDETWQ